MILRPFIAGLLYPVGAYVSDPDTGAVYQVKSPTGDPDEGADVLVGPLTPSQDDERFSYVPEHMFPVP